MSAGAFGRLHDNVAASQLNGGVLASHGDAELRALIHLHQRAIPQPECGVSAASSTGTFAFNNFISNLERLLAAGANAEHHSTERLQTGAHPLRSAGEFCLNDIRADYNQPHRCRNSHPAETRISDLWQLLFPGKRQAALARAALGFTATGNAVMQMRLNQQRAGSSQLPRAILGKELTNIIAAPDGFNLARGR